MDLVLPLQTPLAKIVIDQMVGEVLRLPVLTQKLEWRSSYEGEQPTRPQQASSFRNSPVRIAKGHCPPITEDDVKARIRQRDLFSAGLDQREVYLSLRHETTRMLELS